MVLFGKDKLGDRCEELEDGSVYCRRYKRDKGEKLGTGSEPRIITDPSSCKATVLGDVNDEDVDFYEQKAKEREKLCRRGF
ncbi:MAG: hypothetical protein AABY22_16850 [Nanoarchaeota archaeon]